MTSEGSFLSRLTLKFLEVFAAGLATAVSGFLIAHFAGYLTTPVPAVAVKETPAVQQGVQTGSTPVASEASPAASTASNSTDQVSPSSAATKAHETVDAKADPKTDAKPDSKPELRTREPVEPKPREATRGATAPSFEARMRAALDKAAPANPPSGDAPRRQAVVPVDAAPRVSGAATPPVNTSTGSINGMVQPNDSAPRPATASVEPPPGVTAPAPAAPISLAPPETVEIKSQPVVSVDANAPAPTTAETPTLHRDNPFAAIGRRFDKLLSGNDQPPRPPMPVGQ